MQSRLLTSFLVVAEKASITEAADVLNISQPALTKSMQKLEEQFGVKLLERLPVGVRLTKFGEIVLHHAKVMDNEYRHAISRVEALRDGGSETLSIGAGPVWLASILPPIISQFQANSPNIKISLIGGVIDTLVPALVAGELDLICLSLDFPNQAEVIKYPLFDIKHVLVADSLHPLVGEENLEAASIHKYSWVMLKGDYIGGARIASFFAANGLNPPRVAFETTAIHSALQVLKGGNFISHIPEQMLPLAKETGLSQIKLRQEIWETTGGYALRASSSVSEPVKQITVLLKNSLKAGHYRGVRIKS